MGWSHYIWWILIALRHMPPSKGQFFIWENCCEYILCLFLSPLKFRFFVCEWHVTDVDVNCYQKSNKVCTHKQWMHVVQTFVAPIQFNFVILTMESCIPRIPQLESKSSREIFRRNSDVPPRSENKFFIFTSRWRTDEHMCDFCITANTFGIPW